MAQISALTTIEPNESKIGLAGFENLGNTCYLNSIIQIINVFPELVNFLIKADFFDLLLENYKCDDTKIDCNHIAFTSICYQISRILISINGKSGLIVAPKTLKKIFGMHFEQFNNYDQNDSHEALISILDKMHQELKICTNEFNVSLVESDIPEKWKSILKGKKKKEKTIIIKYQEFVKKTFKDDLSVINGIFQSTYNSIIECTKCNTYNCSFENNSCLSIQIPRTNKIIRLHDSINHYFSPEKIDDYQCLCCNEKCTAIKITKLFKCNKYLIVHLVRFTHVINNSIITLVKNSSRVMYEENLINIDNFRSEISNFDDKIEYELIAINCHMGSIESGHYFSYIKNKNFWYQMNDDTITHVNNVQKMLLQTQRTAYILVYKLKNN